MRETSNHSAMSAWFRTYGFSDVLDKLLIGAYPLDAEDVAMLESLSVDRVFNLVEDEEYRPGEREEAEAALRAAGIDELRIKLIDHGRLPPGALEDAIQEVLGLIRDGQRVYLHCRAGWQRSAAVAAGVVALSEQIEIDEALAYVQIRKPTAEPMPQQRDDLHRWWAERGGNDNGARPEEPAAWEAEAEEASAHEPGAEEAADEERAREEP
jgi:protein-tyrosine phosphatase